ncbi:MAG: hypothetical protein M3081_16980 [Gemmatimonadota bacterium]|nr:hypothetical protein [Gemmatimonadota bacterium]
MKTTTSLTIALTAALALPAYALSAQAALPVRFATHAETTTTAADDAHERGIALMARNQITANRAAARLHLESAALRPAGDSLATRCLLEAAYLFYGVGDLSDARKALTAGGERAVEMGDVVRGATAYLDAASVAQEQRDGLAQRQFMDKARLLSHSPLLTGDQRTEINRRLGN